MSYPKIYHPIVGVLKRTTEKAILLVVTDPEALTEEDATIENWIPKSQIQAIKPMPDVAGNSEVYMSEWIIGQKELNRFIRAKTTAPVQSHPAVPSTPPAKSFVDMDDDVPY